MITRMEFLTNCEEELMVEHKKEFPHSQLTLEELKDTYRWVWRAIKNVVEIDLPEFRCSADRWEEG